MNKLKVVLDLSDIFDVPEELLSMKHDYIGDPNFKYISVTPLNATKENIDLFNKIYFWCKDEIGQKIVRTPSGGICIAGELKHDWQYDVKVWGGLCIELTIIHDVGRWRIQLGSGAPKYDEGERKPMSGHKAYQKMFYYLSKEGINLLDDKYCVDKKEAFKIKMSIPKARIETPRGIEIGIDHTYHHVHHADLNQSFGSGLMLAYPEFKPVVEYLYSKRHGPNGGYYKDILNMFIGYCQSKNVNFKHVKLSYAAITHNNNEVAKLTSDLVSNGYRPLLYNTDGIWYDSYGKDKEPFVNADTGLNLCQWKNDHIDCDLRIQSPGSYEYKELIDGNETVKVVQRGKTKLDDLKPRSAWEWGDIFSTNNAIKYTLGFNEEVGVFRIVNNNTKNE